MLCMLNSYIAACQLCLNKTGGKKPEGKPRSSCYNLSQIMSLLDSEHSSGAQLSQPAMPYRICTPAPIISLIILSPPFPLLTSLQPHWPPCSFSNILGTVLLQGPWMCCSHCLYKLVPHRLHCSLTSFGDLFRYYLLREPSLTIQSNTLLNISYSHILFNFFIGIYSLLMYYTFYILFCFCSFPIECKSHQSSDFCPIVPFIALAPSTQLSAQSLN